MLEVQNKYANRAIIGGLEKFLPALRPELIKEGISEELKSNIESYFAAYSRSSVEDRERSTKDILLLLGEETSTPITTYDKSTLSKPQYQNRNSNYRNTAPPPSETASKPTHGLTAPLHLLNKIGMSRAADFKNLGVNTIGDLLYFFPRRHDDYSTLKTINHLEYDDVLTIIATVQSTLVTKVRNRELSRVEVVVSDGTGFLRLSFFRGGKYAQNFANQFQHGRQLVISGKVEPYLGRKQMNDPSFEELDQSHLSTNGIIPVYPLTSGLSQKIVRTAVNEAVSFYANRVADFLPESIRIKAKIVDINTALTQIHYPKTHDTLLSAQRRLAFDEIFLLQLGVLQQKKSWVTQTAEKFVVEPEIIKHLIDGLTFELTGAQQKTFVEVQKDLASGSPMNRLLQGDVGSGKTIIAALTAAIVVLKDGQAVIMAPTGILAEQHYRSMQKF
ncbi:MAG: DEAD/DEAH box helicase, partial [Anaerolineaceae bacterium]|nr:DEAD/DEAH box helicase [Anaerolineaceae bacterium]